MIKPEQLKNIDLEPLKNICQDYIDYLSSEDFHEDNDYDHYIYECAMETVFGKDVWEYINSKL